MDSRHFLLIQHHRASQDPLTIHHELLKTADFSSQASIKASLWDYAEEVGKGELLWPLRVCLSGKAQSPDPFTLAYVIGQLETLARITTACDKIEE